MLLIPVLVVFLITLLFDPIEGGMKDLINRDN